MAVLTTYLALPVLKTTRRGGLKVNKSLFTVLTLNAIADLFKSLKVSGYVGLTSFTGTLSAYVGAK